MPSDPASAHASVQPRRFSDFELLEELGRGGMGVVYRARRGEEEVALKLLTGTSGYPEEERARFANEAAATARLVADGGVVRVLEAGVAAGQPFMALELLEGGSLAARLQHGPLDPLEAALVMAKVARALAYAHLRGVLHRDLKPANILFDAQGEPKVADFGLCRLVDDPSRLTQTGTAVGTPHYMAPEQARGDKAVDERADIYGLGATLYHVLCGRPPFEGNAAQVMAAVCSGPPAAPSKLRPELDPGLEEIVLRCLAADPRDRYQDAGELADALSSWSPGAPAARGLAVPLAALLAASLAVAVLGWLVLRPGPPRGDDLAQGDSPVPPAPAADESPAPSLPDPRPPNPAAGDRVRAAVLQGIDRELELLEGDVAQRRLSPRDALVAVDGLAREAPDHGRVHFFRGCLLWALREGEPALDAWRSARAAPVPFDELPLWLAHGRALKQLRRYEEAYADLKAAYTEAPGTPGLAFDLGVTCRELRKHAEAAEALAHANRQPGRTWQVPFNLAGVYESQLRFEESEQTYLQAIELAPPGVLWPVLRRCDVLVRLERFDEADAVVRRVLAEHPSDVWAATWFARVQNHRGRNDEALPYAESAWRALPCRDTARAISRVYADLGRREDALRVIAVADKEGYIDRGMRRLRDELSAP